MRKIKEKKKNKKKEISEPAKCALKALPYLHISAQSSEKFQPHKEKNKMSKIS